MPVDQETLEQRRKAKLVLKELRHHQQEVEDDHEDAVDCESNVLQKHFTQATENIQKSSTVDQSVVDAQIFHRLGQYTKKQAEQLQSGLRTYDVKSFAESLHLNMRQDLSRPIDASNAADDDDDDHELMINFTKLGDCVYQKYLTATGMDFMFGNEPKEKAPKSTERKTRQMKKGGKANKPNELGTDQVEQTETDKRVAMMKKELERRRQCNFWMFVIDPDDYTLSTENLFHSSFLIKDSWAQLDMKRDPPILKYRDQGADEEDVSTDPNDEVSRSQYIQEFDQTLWSEMIRKYNIQKCILPASRRPPADEESADVRRVRQYGRGVREERAGREQVTASF